MISLAAATPEAGFALLDMAKVVKAFDDGLAMLPASAIDYVAAGPGDSIWTTIERGSDYAAIPIWKAEINACVSTMRDFFLVLCPSVFEITSSTNTALALACVMIASLIFIYFCRSDRVAVLNIRTRTVKYLNIPGVTRVRVLIASAGSACCDIVIVCSNCR